MQCYADHDIPMASRQSVCLLSVTLVDCDHRLEFFKNNYTVSLA